MLLFDPIKVARVLNDIDPWTNPIPAEHVDPRAVLIARVRDLSFFFGLLTTKTAEPENPYRLRAAKIMHKLKNMLEEFRE